MIRVSRLIFEYPGKTALKDVSFHIRAGTITALVGPNGAGKTTLLRCLAGLSRPFSGEIRIRDIDIIKSPRKCHSFVGFLPDFFGLYDRLTVRQVLTYFARAQRIPPGEISGRIHRVAEWVQLSERIDARVEGLSRGMRQRLGIGIALVHDPEVLLLDEPASGLDPEARWALSELFRHLNGMGKTLIVSSHILAELAQYASEMLVLRDGCIVAETEARAAERPDLIICVETVGGDPPSEVVAGFAGAAVRDGILRIPFAGDAAQQHQLLKSLLEQGVAVAAFYPREPTVQERYLKAMADRS